MLYRDCIENLLQLKDVIVTNIECHGQEMHIWLRMEQRIHKCPRCGSVTSKVHDYRTQIVRDVSISGYATILHLRKRRHVVLKNMLWWLSKCEPPFLAKKQSIRRPNPVELSYHTKPKGGLLCSTEIVSKICFN